MKRFIPGGVKDENGIYLPLPKPPTVVPTSSTPDPDVSLDDIGKRIIVAMDRATKVLLSKISADDVSRETIGALKDCQIMYKDLRKDEKDLLESLSDEDLEKLIKK